jgi:hypothetical protein
LNSDYSDRLLVATVPVKARNGPTEVYGECLMLRAERDPSSKLDFQIDAPPLSRLADHFATKSGTFRTRRGLTAAGSNDRSVPAAPLTSDGLLAVMGNFFAFGKSVSGKEVAGIVVRPRRA